MGAHLITGYAGKEHITSADQGIYNAGTVGNGKYVLETGRMFECEQINSNLVKIHSGDLINQGRHITISANDYEECTIDNGLQGLKRNDLIVMRYRKNKDTDIESAEVVILKGTSGETAEDPEYLTGDILNGDTEDDFLLYRVCLDGIEVKSVEPLFDTVMSIKKMQDETNNILLAKIYPVGSIYMSVNNISPSAFLGGTWVQIKDLFLLSAGDYYSAGSSGGEATHQLTTVEMPMHKHMVEGIATYDDSEHNHSITITGTTNSAGTHNHSVGYGVLGANGTARHTVNAISSASGVHATDSAGAHTHTFSVYGDTKLGGKHAHNLTGKAKDAGGDNPHNNMPPYLTVYMWKRTA